MDQPLPDEPPCTRRSKISLPTRFFVGLALVSLFTGGSALGAAPPPARVLALGDFFHGPLRGAGVEQDSEHAKARTVNFSGTGTRIAGGVRLAYNVVFSDGERQHKVWTFLKVSPGHYIGRRSDVIGDAQVIQSDDDIHMTYTARVTTKSGSHNLSFDETFTRTGPGTLINRLRATYLFFTVASGEITLHKVGG